MNFGTKIEIFFQLILRRRAIGHQHNGDLQQWQVPLGNFLANWHSTDIFQLEFCQKIQRTRQENPRKSQVKKSYFTEFENHKKKVTFNIASEASYVYIFSGQKLIKNAKNGPFWRVFETWSLRSNSVTRQVNFNRTKLMKNAKIQKFKCDILSNF